MVLCLSRWPDELSGRESGEMLQKLEVVEQSGFW